MYYIGQTNAQKFQIGLKVKVVLFYAQRIATAVGKYFMEPNKLFQNSIGAGIVYDGTETPLSSLL